MAKRKVSVTLSPERLLRAQEVTGNSNISELVDDGLQALIERELEARWLAGHGSAPADLPADFTPDLSDLPWEDD